MEKTGENNTLPDGACAPLYYESTITSPDVKATTSGTTYWGYQSEESEQFTSVEGDSYSLLSTKPSDWDSNATSYYSTPTTSNAYKAGYKITIPTLAAKSGAMADGNLTSDELEWTSRSYITPHSVEAVYTAITNANYKTLLGADRYQQIKERKTTETGYKRVDTWSEGVSPLYENAYKKETVYDPVHKIYIADSYTALTKTYKAMTSKPSDWASNWTSYYTTYKYRDTRLNPTGDASEYYSPPEYRAVTLNSAEKKKWKEKYTNYAIWDAKGGQYETISEWQPMASKPSDWKKSNWSDIKEKYAVRVLNEYKTLGNKYKKSSFPSFKKGKFYKKKAPALSGSSYVKLTDKTETRTAGKYQLFKKKAPSFVKSRYYKEVIPDFVSGKYYAQVSPAFVKGSIYISGDNSAPAWGLEPTYSTNSAEDEKLNIRDDWYSNAKFSLTKAATEYGYSKRNKVICNDDAVEQFGARIKRITYDDATTFDELISRAAEELKTLSQASMEFELSAIDLSRAQERQLPNGWNKELDWFYAGERIHITLQNFGIDTVLLCTEMSDYNFNDPESGVMKVGTTWTSRLTELLKPQRIIEPKQSTNNAPLSILDALE